MRLLQLVHGYPPAMGGVELTVRDVCERLVSRYGMDVTVFTTDAYTNENFRNPALPTIPIVEGEEQNGVKVRRFPVDTRFALPLRFLQRFAYTFRLPGNDTLRTLYHGPISPLMLEATLDFEADVICAASFPLNHMTYPFRRPAPRPPVVLVGAAHTNDAWGFRRQNLIDLIDQSYAYVAHTGHERDWLVKQGASAERIRVIGHGIDPDRLRARPGAFRSEHGIPAGDLLVAYVGQQGGHKGIDTLISVLPQLLAACPTARLVVAGSRTPYSATLRGLASELPGSVAERLLILDDISEQSKADLLAGCDIFASPSGFESFGVTTLEAWALCKPVLLGSSPAVREIVEDGVTGLLVPYGSNRRLLAALRMLASDPGRRQEMGQAGHERLLQRHTLDAEVARYYGLYQEAVGFAAAV